MQDTPTPMEFPFKIGDKVQSKANPEEQGEVCCISYLTSSVRVYSDVPFGKAIKCYDADQLELTKEKS